MSLTQPEKVAGRKFRDEEQAKLLATFDVAPPTYVVPNFLSHYRHECPGRNDISTAIELKEQYVLSPEYEVWDEGGVEHVHELGDDTTVLIEGSTVIPPGRFGFIYKEGKCKSKLCGHTARSKAGRLVDSWERPPMAGRVGRVSK